MSESGVNNHYSHLWRFNLSNIPSYDIPGSQDALKKFSIYDDFVKTVSLPDLNVGFHETEHDGYKEYQPISKYNDGWPELSVTWLCNENMENYLRLFFYMLGLRFGKPINGKPTLVTSLIDEGRLSILDNEKRPVMFARFQDMVISSLSQVTLTQGQAEATQFTANFKFHKLQIAAESIFEGNNKIYQT